MKNDSYQCPIKWEGAKVYEGSGVCPVCNMFLVPVATDGATASHTVSDDHHEHAHQQSHHSETVKGDKYYCPMRCEGDKTYDKPGDCPACGMHLQKEVSIKTQEVIYTCPMNPEVKSNKGGTLPKAGMSCVAE